MATAMKPRVQCKQCAGDMVQAKRVEKSLGLQLLGVILFLVGIALLLVFPIGTVAGLILMIGATRLGYKRVKVWKCVACGYFFERAD
jgi:uncharacterized membrane protein YdbT with pleckstrin-like domain